MAMNIHHEARRRQMHMERVCEARRKMAVAQGDEAGSYVAAQAKPEEVMCTDQGQFHQTRSVHVWTGPERNRRSYDRSREGPILGSSRRELEREMNFRFNSLSGGQLRGSQVASIGFRPVDAAFRV